MDEEGKERQKWIRKRRQGEGGGKEDRGKRRRKEVQRQEGEGKEEQQCKGEKQERVANTKTKLEYKRLIEGGRQKKGRGREGKKQREKRRS